MNVHFLDAAPKQEAAAERFQRSIKSMAGSSVPAQFTSAIPSERDRLRVLHTLPPSELSTIWGSLLDFLPQGIVILTRNLEPLYWNQCARKLCSNLVDSSAGLTNLPRAISEVCHHLIKAGNSGNETVIMECHSPENKTVRLTARWLNAMALFNQDEFAWSNEPESRSPSYFFLTLEDCQELLRQELAFEQKKYDLTEREAEVWMLLRQEYTYQEIAKLLQISLNTVKTHVKNVYAKRRSNQGQAKYWCEVQKVTG